MGPGRHHTRGVPHRLLRPARPRPHPTRPHHPHPRRRRRRRHGRHPTRPPHPRHHLRHRPPHQMAHPPPQPHPPQQHRQLPQHQLPPPLPHQPRHHPQLPHRHPHRHLTHPPQPPRPLPRNRKNRPPRPHHAPHAFRHLSQAKHTGKIALTIPQPPNPNGTILITGGTGALATHLTRHLATHHPGTRIILTTRQNPAPDHHPDDANITTVTCDITDPQQLAQLLETVPPEHPLTAVVHTAGVTNDHITATLTADHLSTTLTPKTHPAHHLHRLTRSHDLAAFITFSSIAGTLGSAGQAAYAAANSYLDALAQHRRAEGLPATSLAWGLWAGGGMAADLDDVDLARVRRAGIRPLTPEQGVSLFDAYDSGPALLIPARLDTAALRAQADSGALPPILNRLVQRTARRAAPSGETGETGETWRLRLAELAEADRRQALMDLVRAESVTVLGHDSPSMLKDDQAFKEAGFDSLTGVELRNRLNARTGLRLSSTLVFDHPTPAALAGHLLALLAPVGNGAAAEPSALADLGRLESTVLAAAADPGTRATVTESLTALLQKVRDIAEAADGGSEDIAARLDAATDEDLFDFIENEL
nr:type I polyketide synthase [Micromonospora sp.]